MALAQQKIEEPHPFIHFASVFTAQECDSIISIAKSIGTHRALTGSGDVSDLRRSRIVWLHRQPSVEWIYAKLEECALQTVSGWFPCDLNGNNEAIQITHYDASEIGHYDWHMDMGPGDTRTRKLSMVVMLSNPEDFDGGALHVQWSPNPVQAKMVRGHVVTFPSYALHRVNPVMRGERFSMVWWMHGPVWR